MTGTRDDAPIAMTGLVRPREGRFVLGVCAGIARYTNIDPLLVRVAFAILGFTGGVLLYLAAWLLMRPADGGPSFAERWTARGMAGDTVLGLFAAGLAAMTALALIQFDLNAVSTATVFVIVMLTAHARGADVLATVRSLPSRLRRGNAPPPPEPQPATQPFSPRGPFHGSS